MNMLTYSLCAVSFISQMSFSYLLLARGSRNDPDNVPPKGGTGGVLPAHTNENHRIPPLIGRDPNDPKVIKEYLADGFRIEVVGHQKSSKIKKGSIISQTPAPYTEIVWPLTRKDAFIKVIISTGE